MGFAIGFVCPVAVAIAFRRWLVSGRLWSREILQATAARPRSSTRCLGRAPCCLDAPAEHRELQRLVVGQARLALLLGGKSSRHAPTSAVGAKRYVFAPIRRGIRIVTLSISTSSGVTRRPLRRGRRPSSRDRDHHRSPLVGLHVNITPATVASTIRCTATPIDTGVARPLVAARRAGSASPAACGGSPSSGARGRHALGAAAASHVSSSPAKLASSPSSVVALDRTATGGALPFARALVRRAQRRLDVHRYPRALDVLLNHAARPLDPRDVLRPHRRRGGVDPSRMPPSSRKRS